MIGTDTEPQSALETLSQQILDAQRAVTLQSGDALVTDNTIAVHGRTPFSPRFDGTDRWLQRAFVISDLVPSANERTGRVITTRFETLPESRGASSLLTGSEFVPEVHSCECDVDSVL